MAYYRDYIVLYGNLVFSFIFVLGLIWGSFLNSWMWRVRENIRIFAKSRSMCTFCRRQLKWFENIPVVSYLFLGGRCRTCKNEIPSHYPLVEFFSGVLLVFIFERHLNISNFSEWTLLRDVFFLTYLIIIFAYDFRYKLILSRIVWSGAVIGFVINVFFLNYSVVSLLLASLVVGGFFWLQYVFSGGRWIGGGDVRLGFMMGIWLGWPNVLVALFLAYIIGATIAVFLILSKKVNAKTEIPFGAFLALGTFIALYYGSDIITWYSGFLR